MNFRAARVGLGKLGVGIGQEDETSRFGGSEAARRDAREWARKVEAIETTVRELTRREPSQVTK